MQGILGSDYPDSASSGPGYAGSSKSIIDNCKPKIYKNKF